MTGDDARCLTARYAAGSSASSEGAGGVLALALTSVITAVAQGGRTATRESDAETLHALQQLDTGSGRREAAAPPTDSGETAAAPPAAAPTQATVSSARHKVAPSATQPPSVVAPPMGPLATMAWSTSRPPSAECSAPGWGLPTADALKSRAQGRVQGLRMWSSKRLGQLGSSLAETVETVKVKGAARGIVPARCCDYACHHGVRMPC